MRIISVIPARGGSKGILRKNLTLLYNKPLIAYSIEQSLKSRLIDDTFVSTEDDEIKIISMKYGAKVITRPSELATDTSSTESVLLHASKVLNNDFNYMVLLQPTFPIRYPKQIDEAIEIIQKENTDSLLSVYKNQSFLWDKRGLSLTYDFKNRPRRQDKEWEFVENGSIYISKKETLLNDRNRLGGNISFYEMPKWMSFEVDTPFDFDLIKFLIKQKRFLTFKSFIERVKLIIFDVDGVFTDGSVYLNKRGDELLKFSRIDGKGIELLRNFGLKTAVITSEDSEIIKLRMDKLKIDDIFIGIKDKIKIYTQLKEKYSLQDQEICYLGDDIQDLDIIRKVGFSSCPNNAQQIIKDSAIYSSPFYGGHGFVRDVCNLIIENI